MYTYVRAHTHTHTHTRARARARTYTHTHTHGPLTHTHMPDSAMHCVHFKHTHTHTHTHKSHNWYTHAITRTPVQSYMYTDTLVLIHTEIYKLHACTCTRWWHWFMYMKFTIDRNTCICSPQINNTRVCNLVWYWLSSYIGLHQCKKHKMGKYRLNLEIYCRLLKGSSMMRIRQKCGQTMLRVQQPAIFINKYKSCGVNRYKQFVMMI